MLKLFNIVGQKFVVMAEHRAAWGAQRADIGPTMANIGLLIILLPLLLLLLVLRTRPLILILLLAPLRLSGASL